MWSSGSVWPRFAAADEVNDLKAVASFDGGVVPSGAGEDFEVALDRNAVGAHSQVPKQRGHSQAGRDFASFSVDNNLDGSSHFASVWGAPVLPATPAGSSSVSVPARGASMTPSAAFRRLAAPRTGWPLRPEKLRAQRI